MIKNVVICSKLLSQIIFIQVSSKSSNPECQQLYLYCGKILGTVTLLYCICTVCMPVHNSVQHVKTGNRRKLECHGLQREYSSQHALISSIGDINPILFFFLSFQFLQFEGRKYCEHDFNMLFAPCCGKCSEYIYMHSTHSIQGC